MSTTVPRMASRAFVGGYGTISNAMKTYAFIDAANLFYGGEKSLGWKIDYKKLLLYLQEKHMSERVFYFGGVETHGFVYDYQSDHTVPLAALEQYLVDLVSRSPGKLNEADLALIGRHLQRVRFYRKLEAFGYELVLKPVKTYRQEDGTTRRKANCDVDLAFYLMREYEQCDCVLILSGDGDFLPVLRHVRSLGKTVRILARGNRAAKEIRQFAGDKFLDFTRLENRLRYEGA